MRSTLQEEIIEFLQQHGPARSLEIGLAVRARRADVDVVLAAGPFKRLRGADASRPKAVLFDVRDKSGRVARPRVKSRATLMLSVLRDGRWHSRREIFEKAGAFFLTNNAANELRQAGHAIVYDRTRDAYRLAPAAAMRAPSAARISGSVAA